MVKISIQMNAILNPGSNIPCNGWIDWPSDDVTDWSQRLGWDAWKDYEYYITTEKVNAYGAADACGLCGGNRVTFVNMDEQNFIRAMV